MTNFVHKLTETVELIGIPKSVRVDKSVGTMRAAIADRLRFVAAGETFAINFDSQFDILVCPFRQAFDERLVLFDFGLFRLLVVSTAFGAILVDRSLTLKVALKVLVTLTESFVE